MGWRKGKRISWGGIKLYNECKLPKVQQIRDAEGSSARPQKKKKSRRSRPCSRLRRKNTPRQACMQSRAQILEEKKRKHKRKAAEEGCRSS